MWVKIVILLLALLLVGLGGAFALGTYRWRAATRDLVLRLNASRYAGYAEHDGMRIPLEGEVEW